MKHRPLNRAVFFYACALYGLLMPAVAVLNEGRGVSVRIVNFPRVERHSSLITRLRFGQYPIIIPAMASTRVGNEIKEVLALGKEVASAIVDRSGDALDILDRYVEAFAKWEATWKAKLKGSEPLTGKEKEAGQRIAAQHAQILRLTEEMRAEVEASLKTLHVKGKGLKSYIDQLPQRISTIKPKQG